MASRKEFRDFARGIASRFVSRNNDVAGYWGVGVLSKGLHDRGLDEAEFDILTVSSGVAVDSARWLRRRLVETGIPAEWVTSAKLRVAYFERAADSTEWWPQWIARPTSVPLFRLVATATITDDFGRVWEDSASTWCWDHDPNRERRRGVWPPSWLDRSGFPPSWLAK